MQPLLDSWLNVIGGRGFALNRRQRLRQECNQPPTSPGVDTSDVWNLQDLKKQAQGKIPWQEYDEKKKQAKVAERVEQRRVETAETNVQAWFVFKF